MKPLCPNCQTELTDDFGLVDCKFCGVVCSVDLDDNVTIQGDEPAAYEEDPVDDDSLENNFEEILNEDVQEGDEDLGVQSTSEDGDLEELEDEEQVQTYDSDEASLADDSEDIGLSELEEEEKPSYVQVEEPKEKISVKPKKKAPKLASTAITSLNGEDFLKDLELFSDEAPVAGGHIYYDFHVAGLEGVQKRELFIETLADSRLEISEDAVREILGESSNFTLPQVSFLRLTVIYRRLLSLNLDMSWSLSELQEPRSYLSEEIEEVSPYGDQEDSELYEEVDSVEDEY